MLAFMLLAAANCGPKPLTLEQAKALVLAAPNIRAAVRMNAAEPVFAWVGKTPTGWRFDVNSATPCAEGVKACSTLLGHYSVVRRTGAVYDLDADGGEGALASSPEMARVKAALRLGSC